MDVDAQPGRRRKRRRSERLFNLQVSRAERLLSVRRAHLLAQDPAVAALDLTELRDLPRAEGEPDGMMDLVEVVQAHGARAACATAPPRAGYVLEEGRTPLHYACYLGLGEYAELLVARGADLYAIDGDECLPLHRAASTGCVRCVRAVACDGLGSLLDFVLHEPALNGWEEVVRILISVGAGVGECSDDGERGLLFAAHRGHFGVVRLLAEAGVDLRAKMFGIDAVEAARRHGHFEIVSWLEERIDREARDLRGCTEGNSGREGDAG